MSGRPTSRDVAREAGVSQAAVSLVLSEKWVGRVSAGTAERVRVAADELGYRPNVAARSLRLGATRTVLLVAPALTTEYFGELYTGVARVAADAGVGVLLYPSPAGIGQARDPFTAAASVDGVLATSMPLDALSTLRRGRAPLVMVDSDPGEAVTTVNLDLVDGVQTIVWHLVDLGHRNFLHLAADVPSWTFGVRARTLTEQLGGVAGATLSSARSPISVAGGDRAVTVALQQASDRPTALVCDNDRVAAGAYKALRRLGLDVPTDVSVVSLDDFTVGSAVDPELTALHFDAQLLGERGMRALLASIAGDPVDDAPVPVDLVVRGSTSSSAR